MLSFLPPEITEADTTILLGGFKLYHSPSPRSSPGFSSQRIPFRSRLASTHSIRGYFLSAPLAEQSGFLALIPAQSAKPGRKRSAVLRGNTAALQAASKGRA